MTDLEALAELTTNCGLKASVEIKKERGKTVALIKPASDASFGKVFSVLEALCKEISFAVPVIGDVIVDFGDSLPPTIVDCAQYQR